MTYGKLRSGEILDGHRKVIPVPPTYKNRVEFHFYLDVTQITRRKVDPLISTTFDWSNTRDNKAQLNFPHITFLVSW